MPVAVIMEFKGSTMDQYDQVVEKMGFSHGGPGAPGGLFHWVTETDDGFRVTDVWETKEQYEQFAEAKIGPLAAEAGLAGPPEVSYRPVHNYLTAG
jgi:hypothetical protein